MHMGVGEERLQENFQTRNPRTAGLQSFFLPGKWEKKHPCLCFPEPERVGPWPKAMQQLRNMGAGLGLPHLGTRAFQCQSFVGSLPQ